jgi:hypothetical protein
MGKGAEKIFFRASHGSILPQKRPECKEKAGEAARKDAKIEYII